MKDLNHVFSKAKKASVSIRALPLSQRLELISRLKAQILDQSERIISEIQKETKKTRTDALMSEIFPALDHLAYLEKFAAKSLADEKVYTSIALMGKKSKIYYEPLGTVLVISPWNYPFYQAIVPCTASFVTGNATLYKPSEHTPLKGLVEELLQSAGFQEDWVQVIYGDGAVGAQLMEMPPQKVFFTGSVATGKKIMEKAAQTLTPVELELGGKDPMLVFEDADIGRAAAGALWGGLTNAGQSCTSVERLYIQDSIYEKFKDALCRMVISLKQGVDSDGDSDLGGMTTPMQAEVIQRHLKDALAKGANQLTGNEWTGDPDWIPAILLENVTDDMLIAQEETFGPVIPLMRFKTEEEAIQKANDSEYGLSASVWTADKARADRVTRALETGNVSVNNVMLSEGNHALPFGGVKNSGIGRFKGEMGLRGFCNVKSVLIDSNSSKREVNWYPYTQKKYVLFSKMMKGLFTGGLGSFLRFLITGLKLETYSDRVGKKGRE